MRKIALMAMLAMSMAACAPKPEPQTNTLDAMNAFTKQEDAALDNEQARDNAINKDDPSVAMNGVQPSSPLTQAVKSQTGCGNATGAPCQ